MVKLAKLVQAAEASLLTAYEHNHNPGDVANDAYEYGRNYPCCPDICRLGIEDSRCH